MRFCLKKIAVALIFVLICTAFMGCTDNEIKVLDAMLKSTTMFSCEQDTEISIHFDVKGLTEEEQLEFEMIKEMIDHSNLNLNQKMLRNEKNTFIQQEIQGLLQLADMKMDFGIWIDMDLNSEEPFYKQIIKMPSMFTGFYGSTDKPYMVLDLFSLMSEGNEAAEITSDVKEELSSLMNSSYDTNVAAIGFIKDYAKSFEPGMTVIKRNGSKKVEGISLPKYRLEIGDQSGKRLLRHVVNNLSENEDVYHLIRNQMLIQEKMTSINPLYSNMEKDIENDIPDETDIQEFKASFNQFMDEMDNMNILGSGGIVVDYVINNDGYIVYESGIIDIELNINELEKVMVEEDENTEPEKSNGTIQLEITYTTETKNINEDITIEIPELTDENAFNFEDMETSYEREDVEDVIDDSRDMSVHVNDMNTAF